MSPTTSASVLQVIVGCHLPSSTSRGCCRHRLHRVHNAAVQQRESLPSLPDALVLWSHDHHDVLHADAVLQQGSGRWNRRCYGDVHLQSAVLSGQLHANQQPTRSTGVQYTCCRAGVSLSAFTRCPSNGSRPGGLAFLSVV